MILRCLVYLTVLTWSVLADVQITTPAAGASIQGMTIDVEWTDGSGSPKLADLTTYDIFLCAGGNTEGQFVPLTPLKQTGSFSDGNSASGVITPGLGANVKNAYFLRITSVSPSGVVINYSKRFSLSDMTGSFPAQVEAGLKTVASTEGPAAQLPAAQANVAANPTVAAGDFGIPYLAQSGPIRFAPMPPIPATKITAKNAKTQYPTFPYDIFKSNQGTPNAQRTVTQEQTFSISSREGYMSPAPMPDDSDMAKFLRRWVDE